MITIIMNNDHNNNSNNNNSNSNNNNNNNNNNTNNICFSIYQGREDYWCMKYRPPVAGGTSSGCGGCRTDCKHMQGKADTLAGCICWAQRADSQNLQVEVDILTACNTDSEAEVQVGIDILTACRQ